MQQKIKELRIKIDGLSQLVKSLKPIEVYNIVIIDNINSKEIEKSYDSLILAKAWLGKILGELGLPTPYQRDGDRHSIEDIEKTADTSTINIYNIQIPLAWNELNHIEKVDWLRQEIKNRIESYFTEGYLRTMFPINDKIDLYETFILKYLSEARFWLGFELERIKNSGE